MRRSRDRRREPRAKQEVLSQAHARDPGPRRGRTRSPCGRSSNGCTRRLSRRCAGLRGSSGALWPRIVYEWGTNRGRGSLRPCPATGRRRSRRHASTGGPRRALAAAVPSGPGCASFARPRTAAYLIDNLGRRSPAHPDAGLDRLESCRSVILLPARLVEPEGRHDHRSYAAVRGHRLHLNRVEDAGPGAPLHAACWRAREAVCARWRCAVLGPGDRDDARQLLNLAEARCRTG